MANKVIFGLENVHYSVITEDESGKITYGEPKEIKGAVNLTAEPSGESTDFYADNISYYAQSTNQGYEGDLEVALLPEDFKVEVLGFKKEKDGAIKEYADAIPKSIALGFQVSGDANERRTWYVNCTVARPGNENSTNEKSVNIKTEKLKIKMHPRKNDKLIKIVYEKKSSDDAKYDGFFKQVETPAV